MKWTLTRRDRVRKIRIERESGATIVQRESGRHRWKGSPRRSKRRCAPSRRGQRRGASPSLGASACASCMLSAAVGMTERVPVRLLKRGARLPATVCCDPHAYAAGERTDRRVEVPPASSAASQDRDAGPDAEGARGRRRRVGVAAGVAGAAARHAGVDARVAETMPRVTGRQRTGKARRSWRCHVALRRRALVALPFLPTSLSRSTHIPLGRAEARVPQARVARERHGRVALVARVAAARARVGASESAGAAPSRGPVEPSFGTLASTVPTTPRPGPESPAVASAPQNRAPSSRTSSRWRTLTGDAAA